MTRSRRRARAPSARVATALSAARVPWPVRPSARFAFLLVAVELIVLVVHLPVLSSKALSFDDGQYFVENRLVRNPSWNSTWRFLKEVRRPSTVRGYYQPLPMISLMLDYAMGGRGDNLRPVHRASLCLHLANTALIASLVYLLFGQPWVAAAAAVLFGIHPMTVETICWVGERKTLLAAFFSLSSMVLYVLYSRASAWRYYVASVAAFMLALMSKPTSLPVPALLLLLDFWPLNRLNRGAVLEKLPFFVLAAVSAAIGFWSQKLTAVVVTPGFEDRWLRIPLIVCHDIFFYLHKMFWPVNLSSHYPFPKPMSLSNPAVAVGVAGTFVLLTALLISLRRTRALMTGWLFFFVGVLPTMQVVRFSDVIAADKFAYLPSVGVLLILAWLLVRLGTKVSGKGWRGAAVAALVLVAGLEAFATRSYLADWSDSITLFRRMTALSPNSFMVHYGLGNAYRNQNRMVEAIEEYRRSLELKPDYAEAYNNLGIALAEAGRRDQAAEAFAAAVRIKPDYAEGRTNLGVGLMWQGKLDEAMVHCARAVELAPDDVDANINIGAVLAAKGKLQDAVSYYVKVLTIAPDNHPAHDNLTILLARLDRLDEALGHHAEASRTGEPSAEARLDLGDALMRAGRIDEAVKHYKSAVESAPGLASAHAKLARALVAQGKTDDAVDEYREVLRLDPNDERARHDLQRLSSKRRGTSQPSH